MDATQIILVGGGALLAGAMNAMAGGGTFFSFPALLAAGLPPVMANASNSVAMWPASLSSAWAYRREVSRHPRWTLMLVLISFIGGIAGGLFLSQLPVVGTLFGALIGSLLGMWTLEFYDKRSAPLATKAMMVYSTGVFLTTVLEVTLALAMIALLAWNIFWG